MTTSNLNLNPGSGPVPAREPWTNIDLRIRGMRHSATIAINEHCNELIRNGRQVFKLGLGQSPFPVPESVVQALRDHAHEKDYLPVSGLRALRNAVAEYHERRDGVYRTGDDVLIGPGSKELMFLLQLVYYGDLLLPTPAWVSYAPQARIIGRNVQFLATRPEDGWRLTPEDLARACHGDAHRPRVLILNYPSNPTGNTYERGELADLAAVAREYSLILLSDEIYGELHHEGEHATIAHYYPEGTIISSGLSKWCGAGGWRLGTFLFPPAMNWLREAMASTASETFTATSAPIQYAAVRAYQGGPDIDAYLDGSRRVLAALGHYLVDEVRALGARCVTPRGGFYLFPSFADLAGKLAERGVTTSTELCARLLDDTGVAILPGTDFGRPEHELSCRLAYVDFDGGAALAALAGEPGRESGDESGSEIDQDFLRTHCPRMCQAMDRMSEWFTAHG